MKNPVDLRSEMNRLLQDYGYYVLLHRESRKIHCVCWNEKYNEGDHDCTICGGTGWVSKIERHITRSADANIPTAEPTMNQLAEFGRSYVLHLRWYFKHDVFPKVGDIIYEVQWDIQRPHVPAHLVATHLINNAIPKRGDNGRIEYWVAVTRTETTNRKAQKLVVLSMGPIKDYILKP